MLLDGQPPGDAHGLDVDESGAGTLSEPRMPGSSANGDPSASGLEVTFDAPGVRAYVYLGLTGASAGLARSSSASMQAAAAELRAAHGPGWRIVLFAVADVSPLS